MKTFRFAARLGLSSDRPSSLLGRRLGFLLTFLLGRSVGRLMAWGFVCALFSCGERGLLQAQEAARPDAGVAPAPETASGHEAEEKRFWDEKLKPFLAEHCVSCHSGEDAEAGIDLSIVDETSPLE